MNRRRLDNRFQLILISLIGLVGLVGCGRKNRLEIPAEVQGYVARFELLGAERGVPIKIEDLVIQFANLPNPLENGACEIAGDETPQIVLSNSAWKNMDDAEREELVFHELGHCVLRRKHRDEKSSGVPISVMYTYSLHSTVYTNYYDAYLAELYAHRNEF